MRLSFTLAFALTSVAYCGALARPSQGVYYTSPDVAVAVEGRSEHAQPELYSRAYEYSEPLVTRDVSVEWPELQARAYHGGDEDRLLFRRGPEKTASGGTNGARVQQMAQTSSSQAGQVQAGAGSRVGGGAGGGGVRVTFAEGTNPPKPGGFRRRPSPPPPASGFRGWVGQRFGN
ncbi:hypothetical protein K474DRAFT_1659509 [Panus rudis PR-1116 ss-1]|nr:hypothetical protein K474DRAFT_1659509 [Panus rudis PR-1116 ss-1]